MSIIGIWGSGQSGKTEIAVALAEALTQQGSVVGLISAEDYPELAAKLGIKHAEGRGIVPAMSFGSNIDKCAVEVKKGMGLFLLAGMPFDTTFDLTFTKDQAERLLKSADDLYDVVVVDCTTAKQNAISGEALGMARHVITPIPGKVEAKYWHDANRMILNSLAGRTLFVRSCTEKHFDYDRLEEAIGCDPFCTVPFCGALPELRAEGKGLLNGGRQIKGMIDYLAQEVTA